MTRLYYTPPSDELFEELRREAMDLWREVDTDGDKYGYATEKIDAIKGIKNVGDNYMYIVAMFDVYNQAKLAKRLSAEARAAVRERMIDGGQPEYLIPF